MGQLGHSASERARTTSAGIYSRLCLMLEVSEAANSQLELRAVLDAVAGVLESSAPVDAIEVITRQGALLFPQIFHANEPRCRVGPGKKSRDERAVPLETAEPVPVAGSATEHVWNSGRLLIVQNTEADGAFPENARLSANGIRRVVRAPLKVQEDLIGSIAFCRASSMPEFTDQELEVLEDVSRSAVTAVSNSLAYGEILRQNHQLHAENLVLKEEIDRESMFEEIVGSASRLRKVLDLVERVATTDSTVLITGETGTGKELIARAIHRHSRRSAHALVKVNCATLPEPLVMSELFGHEKGAFTGASRRRIGRFEAANGGTIFLDEIGELSIEAQAALLRVLQEGEFERIGGNPTIHTDVRVIAATNRDLWGEVERGRFRSDLFYRLNVFPIMVPPVRERSEDIPILVEYFAARYASALGKRFHKVDRATIDLLTSYSWPGNVRELQNVIERAVILCDGDVLRVERDVLGRHAGSKIVQPRKISPLQQQELKLIESALARTHGKISGSDGAAAKLGIPPSTLEYKIRKLRIDKFGFRSRVDDK